MPSIDAHMLELGKRRFGISHVPSRSGARDPQRARRHRHARDHADRRRQVAVLSAPRARARRRHARRLAADRADEGSARQARRARHRGAAPRLHAVAARRAGRARRGSSENRPCIAYVTPERLGEPRFRERLATRAGRAVRRRRGALHLAVGARLPPRVPRPRRGGARARQAAGARADRDRAAEGQGRHPRAAPDPRGVGDRHRARSPEPALPRHQGVERAQEAGAAAAPDREAAGLRHHLRRDGEDRRRARRLPVVAGRRVRSLPRPHAREGSRARADARSWSAASRA